MKHNKLFIASVIVFTLVLGLFLGYNGCRYYYGMRFAAHQGKETANMLVQYEKNIHHNRDFPKEPDRKSTRLNSSHQV